MISIIIPMYNAHDYISRCFQSVLAQTYDDWEIIAVDDGSDDDSFSLAEKFSISDKRIHVFKHRHCGVSTARNYAIDNCNGDFIYFLDVDDFLSVDCFENLMNSYDMYPSTDAVIGKYAYFYSNKAQKYAFSESKDLILNRDAFLIKMFEFKEFGWETCGKLFRREVIGNIRYDIDITSAEDLLFTWNVGKNVRSVVVNNCSDYKYCQNLGSSVHSGFSRSHAISTARVFEEIYRTSGNESIELQKIILKLSIEYELKAIIKLLKNNFIDDILSMQLIEKSIYLYNENKKYGISIDPSSEKVIEDFAAFQHPYEPIQLEKYLNKSIKAVIDSVQEFSKNHEMLFIYGAGSYGNFLYDLLKKAEISVDGFVVSDGEERRQVYEREKKLYCISDVNSKKRQINLGIVIAVRNKVYPTIVQKLAAIGIDFLNLEEYMIFLG